MGHKTILIADDEYGFRYPWRIFLKNKGFNIIEASNKAQVLEKISKADILIMDVIFPEEREGIDIVKEIRENQDEMIRSIPVIFYSVLTENMCANELKDIDKRSYIWLQKPVELTTMSRAISNFLKVI